MYKMVTYSASQARAHLSDILDAALRGETVAIERHGEVFEVKTRRGKRHRTPRAPLLATWTDPAIKTGNWTWTEGPDGLAFQPRSTRKRG